jgi:hypothetical protein
MTDYSTARYWAISSIGYGKGFDAEEAVRNYVATQLRNYPASTTVFKTRKAWTAALTDGEAAPQVWLAPEGWTGFVLGMGSHWTREVDGKTEHRRFEAEDRVDVEADTEVDKLVSRGEQIASTGGFDL